MDWAARKTSLWRIVRYYQAGIINLLFGLALFSILVKLGMNMYLAQLVSHCCGVAFNYFTYSRHAFPDAEAPSKRMFVLAYVGNYLLGLVSLMAFARIIASPYIAFFVAVVFVTFINYFVLRRFVFFAKAPPS